MPQPQKFLQQTFGEVEISACVVNKGCKIGYIRPCMRPLLQPVFPCLAAFFSVWQSVDKINRLRAAELLLPRALFAGVDNSDGMRYNPSA